MFLRSLPPDSCFSGLLWLSVCCGCLSVVTGCPSCLLAELRACERVGFKWKLSKPLSGDIMMGGWLSVWGVWTKVEKVGSWGRWIVGVRVLEVGGMNE